MKPNENLLLRRFWGGFSYLPSSSSPLPSKGYAVIWTPILIIFSTVHARFETFGTFFFLGSIGGPRTIFHLYCCSRPVRIIININWMMVGSAKVVARKVAWSSTRRLIAHTVVHMVPRCTPRFWLVFTYKSETHQTNRSRRDSSSWLEDGCLFDWKRVA